MDLSYKEKSIAGSLLISMALFGYYFSKVIQALVIGTESAIKELPFVVFGVIAMMVLVEIGHHMLGSANRASDEEDERDLIIAAKSTRTAHIILVVGCVVSVGHAMLNFSLLEVGTRSLSAMPIVTANMVLLSYVLAEVVGYAYALFLYRRAY